MGTLRRMPLAVAAAALMVVAFVVVGCRTERSRLPANSNPVAREGCWVDVFEGSDYDGDRAHDRIEGPGEWSTMRNLPGSAKDDWGDKVDSLIVGPHARLHLWKDEGFKGPHLEFGPNSTVRKLSEYNFGNEVDSMRIVYVP